MSKKKQRRGLPADYKGASPAQVARSVKQYRPKPERQPEPPNPLPDANEEILEPVAARRPPVS